VYYRLRQVDQDGTAAYSSVQTVAVEGTSLVLYPNPNQGAVTLSGAGPFAAAQVVDALGRVATTVQTDGTGTVCLSGLAPGFYLMRTGRGSCRFVVE
jgi:hypothetical protein